LTELLVVVAIIIVITIAVLPAVLGSLEDRKYSDAARSIQAALAGARDRAVLEKRVVGVRLIRDDTDPVDVSRLVYVGVPEPYSVGTVSVTSGPPGIVNADAISAPLWDQVAPGPDGMTGTPDDIPRVPQATLGPDGQPGIKGWDDDGDGTTDNPSEIGWTGSDDVNSFVRFDYTGRLYGIVSRTAMQLTLSGGAVPPSYGTGTRYQIFTPPAPLAQLDPVLLPDGMVIDVRLPDAATSTARSLGIPGQAGGPMDILFGPNGHIVGLAATQPLIHFWLGARGDKNGSRDRKLLTLNTRTGAVVVYPNPAATGMPPTYVEIYGPAEQALGVSILDVP
jgi:type II secretory pathway pseudopilin PulG